MIIKQTLKIIFFSYLLVMFYACEHKQELSINLSGEWSFKIDSLDQGVKEQWFQKTWSEHINLPGSMTENGLGNDITVETNWTGNMWNDSLWYKDPKMKKYRQKGNVKVPFWLTPVKEYKGAAWYQKTVDIPNSWENKYINLGLERVHWESTVWVDGEKIDMQNSLATAHNFNLSKILTPGSHTISIRIDNRVKDIDVGVDAHSISDNTQSNWNGIIGNIELTATSNSHIGNVKLYPDVKGKKVAVVTQIKNFVATDNNYELQLEVKSKTNTDQVLEKTIKKLTPNSKGEINIDFPMGENPLLWDEFSPNLYEMILTLKSSSGTNVKSIDFGMRDFKTKGTIFTINDRPVFLRGTLECAIFPLTGYPPTDVDSWKRIFKIIQSHGLNHVRFHSWCPPEAAFQAADELGVYLQVEASAWTTIGDGAPVDEWLYKEGEAIINAYGNHPSFVMMTYGNEPSGKHHKEYLKNYVDHFKTLDNRRLYTSAAGWPLIDNLDYYNHKGPRIQGWNQNLESIINKYPPQTAYDYKGLVEKTPMPYVTHEMGQWCVYPNFKEMSKYTGVLKPKNFEIFKETLEENDMLKLADSFLLASGKLQTLCYKADIEADLRTKNLAGFQLLDLHDFPGQGTALVGVLDPFWDEKGYVTPEEYSKFCNETVPLARLEKRIFKNSDSLKASIEVAHFGAKPLNNVTPSWTLTKVDGSVFAKGNFNETNIQLGNGIALGQLNVPLNKVNKALKLTLAVQVERFENTWDVWVYPSKETKIENESNIKVVNTLDNNTIDYLEQGGKVLLNITKGDIAADKGGDIGIGFSSIFWNTSWTNGQKPHTLGILCNPQHPALAHFPTEYHSNWQWWDAMSNSNAIILNDFPKEITPVVRVIDDWFQNRKTALIFEVKVGKGSLLISGIDLHTNIENRLEAKQLLFSLKSYMASDKFEPKIDVNLKTIKALFKK
ncbi:sugar-binding domain-containing protein [Algibacter pacificus]|uniref:sugar-binding domain-containing protein n=1 Tax=Algibacter pacificus TaxID=2599389 RepID=UPI0011C74D73|nr:sugar-binding domain-containing protein [Algibacter pacificus]